jgi:uncharacterized membrane protein
MGQGGPELISSTSACQAAVSSGAIVAEPGYTLVSEVGYAATLIFMLVGVLYLLRSLDLGRDKRLFFALIPFMFFGGALRVVEDANDAVPAGVEPMLAYPWNTLIISPIIYFTVFFVTLAALLVAVWIAREGYAEDYTQPLLAFGSLALFFTVSYLVVLAFTTDYVSWYPQMTVATLGIAALVTAVVWTLVERFAPEINRGTGLIGLVVIGGHAIDGVANMLAADWLDPLNIPLDYGAKHPINRILISVTDSIQPDWLSAAIGTSWTFLAVKMVAAVAVIWVFEEEIFEDSPRYAILLLVAIVAVGLGPGTRDMLRATFGI